MAGREIEIENDLKPLEFYSVEDGDRILVRWFWWNRRELWDIEPYGLTDESISFCTDHWNTPRTRNHLTFVFVIITQHYSSRKQSIAKLSINSINYLFSISFGSFNVCVNHYSLSPPDGAAPNMPGANIPERHFSPFHTEIPENTRVMCCGICSRIVRFAAFTLPVIFRNLCVHSHTTRKDPVKTRDISCDVYNAPLTISLNWRMISASARIVRSSLIAASFQFTYFSSCERWSAFKTPGKTVER